MPQPLSSKENSLFRQVIRNYEDKQYKRGLKAAEQILKKNPKHGDTMAMKALIINQQGKTEEAFALGKEALTADMKSHICWHVYGLLYRHQKNFEEAIKAYKFALKLEPESHQIQRDLAFLQIQMRDYQGYIQSRTAMLQARPQLRQNWTALAVAHHLAGNLSQAEKVLTTYEESLKVPPSKTDYENSEAVMYKNSIIAEMQDYQRALDHLESVAKHNLDRLAVLELRAEYLSKLGRNEEAADAYRTLLDRNPEHPDYYARLVNVLGIDSSDSAAKKTIYDEYAEKNPRSDAAKRLPLDFLVGDEFREAARSYLTFMLDKGVPSTFANLKHLYTDSSKRDILGSLAHEYLESKRTSSDGNTTTNGDALKGEPAALYYLAQHYNYHLSRDLTKAMEFVNKGIESSPDNVEFHMTKARIWKHYGNSQKASETMDQARQLDLKDRYINTKAAKYQLRNNESETALKTMGLFTRNDSPGGPLNDLLEMQSVWYLTEDGEAWVRNRNIGLALKRFHAVYNIFEVWQEDQFDFHSFSLRKGQIRAYVDMIRWEDHIREHPFYTRAALGAIAIYVSMYDSSRAVNGVDGSTGANGDDAAERKKAAKKAKKEAQKAEREAAERAAKQDPNKSKASSEPIKRDDDPNGFRLVSTTDPLAEATKFLAPILQYSPKYIDGQIAGFEVFIRREKYVLALRCLNAALAIDPDHPAVHEQVVRFRQILNEKLGSLPPKVAEVLKSGFTAIDASADLKKFNADFQQKHKDSAEHVISATKIERLLGDDKKKSEKDLAGVLSLKDIQYDQAAEALALLEQWRSSEAETFKKAAHEKWPEVTAFA
ncbi:N-terminal acetyltransferase A, auxiliary subunit [Annulohypoxylon truncatum]|uniref:N-terminal acetyltransferase A, auxiliary subunit n=1 Tax=Annulohypoxylon truncatum TaxID=327061 RepID=UPI002007F04C|nr:N-terminal acetyltransferase A, auxiliary subunit [Annulohypoxylon truncatum]KAI1214261.1 N-terminal acetyltransferase A, auxiliary subunit [Annulohypoxylon truncatum]